MSNKKVTLEFVVGHRVESSFTINPLLIDSKIRRNRKKNVVLDSEEYDLSMGTQDQEGVKPSESAQKVSQSKSDKNNNLKDNVITLNKAMVPPNEIKNKKSNKRGRKAVERNDQEFLDEEEPKIKPPKSKNKSGEEKKENKKGGAKKQKEKYDGSDSDVESDVDDELEDVDALNNEPDFDNGDNGDKESINVDDDFDNESSTSRNIGISGDEGQSVAMSEDKMSMDHAGNAKKLTKRQKSQLKKHTGPVEVGPEIIGDLEEPLLSLPDKKPRKRKNLFLTEEQQIKKLENMNKRKLHTQKLIEEQKKQTIDKILNEAGRKQKQRREKEEKSAREKENRKFRKLPEGEVAIKLVSTKDGNYLILPETFNPMSLFYKPSLF